MTQREWERDTPEGRLAREEAEGAVALAFREHQRRANRRVRVCPLCDPLGAAIESAKEAWGDYT